MAYQGQHDLVAPGISEEPHLLIQVNEAVIQAPIDRESGGSVPETSGWLQPLS